MTKAKTRHRRSRRPLKTGLPPGQLGKSKQAMMSGIHIRRLCYDEATYREDCFHNVNALLPVTPSPQVTWLNIPLPPDDTWIKAIGDRFDIDKSLLEELADCENQPKFEQAGRFDYIVMLRVLRSGAAGGGLALREFHIFYHDGLVLTMHAEDEDELSVLYDRIRLSRGQIRKHDAAYLAYSIMDVLLDQYYGVVEKLNAELDEIEAKLTTDWHDQGGELLPAYQARRKLTQMRRAVWPVREVLGDMLRETRGNFVTIPSEYLQELHDHALQIIDTMEIQRDITSGLLELHMSLVNTRMNDVMRVLAIISTIFMPLAFLSNVFGMNMPEISWPYFFPFCWVVMLVCAFVMLYIFRKNKWL